ncbi:MCE family protein [Pseudolysobacter antarcticus]|uniref:MCE family protein n=1 Tax=Pseudolysobacter antarcticus TaxID=2511995 RepID=A0A411HMX6_9GAMM|nr:MlaD family protein [Pseudolysobacter antarcticus]QBB71831.1 MCE family protein [Pseudolysobacter antarcticus]
METRAHHVLIGVFTLVVVAAAMLFVLWLSKASADREFAYYDVVFTEAVTGLSKGGLVQYNGIKVGEVTQLRLSPKDARNVEARIRVDGGTPIKVDTKAKLASLGLTGIAFIQLSGGAPGSAPLLDTPEQPVPRIIADESALQKLLASSEDIVTTVNDVLFRVGNLLSQENVDRVSRTLQHVDQLSGAIADQRDDLKHVISDLAGATTQLRSTLAQVDKMARTTNDLVDHQGRATLDAASATLAALQRTAEGADKLVSQNREAINNFSNQGLSQIGPTVVELRDLLRSLKSITDQLQDNPAGYLFGHGQPKEFEPK